MGFYVICGDHQCTRLCLGEGFYLVSVALASIKPRQEKSRKISIVVPNNSFEYQGLHICSKPCGYTTTACRIFDQVRSLATPTRGDILRYRIG